MYFADSIDPAKIPADFQYAALYADGDFAVTDKKLVQRFTHRRWITVTGDTTRAGIADYEVGNQVFEHSGKLRQWAADRNHYAGVPAIVYTDMADMHDAIAELQDIPRFWWIATRQHGDLTLAELMDVMASDYDLKVPEASIWAHQFEDVNGEYDRSRLFGRWYR